MSDPITGAGPTALEAMAREVEHGARGVNTCAYDAARELAKALRRVGKDGAVIDKTPAEVKALALARFDRYLPTVGDADRYGDISKLRAYIDRVDCADPMDPFSDKEKWWPRNTMTSDEMLEFYYTKHPERRPTSEKRWPKSAVDYAARYALSSD